ncbi:MAG: hypothetical protein ACI9JL_000343 [Paracoccaceae bacterium]|jgi:hypothetical protein
MADNEDSLEDETRFEIEPSELDETTHAESLILYRDSQDNIRFAKSLQWKTLGGSLAIFALLGFAALNGNRQEGHLKTLIVISWAISAGAIYAICILQSWQNTEREKLRKIVGEFSNMFRAVYRIKSRTEANIHRYILLSFMAITMLLGNYVLAKMLTPFFGK